MQPIYPFVNSGVRGATRMRGYLRLLRREIVSLFQRPIDALPPRLATALDGTKKLALGDLE